MPLRVIHLAPKKAHKKVRKEAHKKVRKEAHKKVRKEAHKKVRKALSEWINNLKDSIRLKWKMSTCLHLIFQKILNEEEENRNPNGIQSDENPNQYKIITQIMICLFPSTIFPSPITPIFTSP